MRNPTRFCLFVSIALAAALAASGAAAQEYGESAPEEETSISARLSLVEGAVSYQRGDYEDWMPAALNVPFVWGDRLYADRGSRAELQISGGSMIRIGGDTELAALNLSEGVKQFKIGIGTVSVHVRSLDPDEVYEFDTPNAAVTLQAPGVYRIRVDEAGDTRAAVRAGEISVSSGGGEVSVAEGEEILLRGIDRPVYDIIPFGGPDVFDRWCDRRDRLYLEARSYGYVSPGIAGVAVLDQYGDWRMEGSFGWVWFPRVAAGSWAPYRLGYWTWIDPWGWTWVSTEPWGWAPYHYGRWALFGSRWAWIPVRSSVVRVAWAPALVGFAGAGPGWSVHVGLGGAAYVGWFPLGPGDPLMPYWRPHWTAGLSVTHVRFVNRAYVTVVPQTVFVEARPVNTAYVRDAAVVRRIAQVPIARGPVPVVPTTASLRVAAVSRGRVPVPSRQILARSVVVRTAPPPAPPSFAVKRALIAENRGAPVRTAEAEALAMRGGGAPRAVAPVRAAAAGEAPVLRPARGTAAPPRPVTAFRGRELARPNAPVVPRAAAPERGSGPPPAPVTVPERPAERRPAREAAPPVREGAAPRPETPAPAPVTPPERRRTQPRPEAAPSAPRSPERQPPPERRPATRVTPPPAERSPAPPVRERRAPESVPPPAPRPAPRPSPSERAPERRTPERAGQTPQKRESGEKEKKKPEKKKEKGEPKSEQRHGQL
jgi:Family of unknown function (DUF6600)/FecR protein